jgi:hypothetical protein
MHDNQFESHYSSDSNNLDNITNDSDIDLDKNILLARYRNYNSTAIRYCIENNDIHSSCINLLQILKKSNSPIYLYDQIIQWAKNSSLVYNINFQEMNIPNRKQIINTCKNQFDLKYIEPFEKDICLRGSNTNTKIVVHDFTSLLYSLLNDDNLMAFQNLLLPNELISTTKKTSKLTNNIINDIDTGSVYINAKKKFITDPQNQLLCPIIFL